MPAPPRRVDPDAFELSYALGRVWDWVLGPAPLAANLALALFAGLGVVLWRLGRDPESFGLPWWLIVWAGIVVVHAVLVVIWASLRSRTTARRSGPVYYAQIPPERRTRRQQVGPATPVASTSSPAPPASWEGALAPVTPFPTRRASDPPVRGRDDSPPPASGRVGSTDTPAVAPDAPPSPALQSARDVLASDQPFWRRMRRRSGADAPGTLPSPSPLPVPPAEAPSWLAPYPGAPPVTQAPSALPATQSADHPGAGNGGSDPVAGPSDRQVTTGAGEEQLPSLAAMLRSSNLTSLSGAPIVTGTAPLGTGTGRPERALPDDSRASVAGSPGSTAALFAAFGIDGDEPAPGSSADPTPSATGTADTLPAPPQRPAAGDRSVPAWGPVVAAEQADRSTPAPAAPGSAGNGKPSTTISRLPTPDRER